MGMSAGKDGEITIDAEPAATITSWEVTEETEALEVNVIGTDVKETLPGKTGWSATFEGLYDPEDAAAAALISGAVVAFELYPAGNQSGEAQIDGTGMVESLSETGAGDGLVEFSASIQGSGVLARTVIAP